MNRLALGSLSHKWKKKEMSPEGVSEYCRRKQKECQVYYQ